MNSINVLVKRNKMSVSSSVLVVLGTVLQIALLLLLLAPTARTARIAATLQLRLVVLIFET